MSIDLSPVAKSKAIFPGRELAACLQDELVVVVKDTALMQGQAIPAAPAAIVTASIQIDSLDVVGVLCKLDELLGFELPHGVVRAGGYGSISEAVQHIIPRVEKIWNKRNGGAA